MNRHTDQNDQDKPQGRPADHDQPSETPPVDHDVPDADVIEKTLPKVPIGPSDV